MFITMLFEPPHVGRGGSFFQPVVLTLQINRGVTLRRTKVLHYIKISQSLRSFEMTIEFLAVNI